MGLIQRQTFKNNLIAYPAVIVGAYASLIIYPYDVGLKGYADALLKWALLIFPFMALGMSVVIVRFVPYLKTGKGVGSARLLTRGLVVCTATLTALCLVNLLAGETLIAFLAGLGLELGKLQTDRWAIIGLVAAMAYASVMTAYLRSLHRIAVPAVFNSLIPKVGLPALVCLVVFGGMTVPSFIVGLIILYWLGLIGLFVYTALLGKLKFHWGSIEMEEKSRRDVFNLAGFSVIGSLGSVLATHLDTLSINNYIGDFETGVYTFAVFVVTVIAIPYKAVNGIAAPIVAKAWKASDTEQLGFLYRQTAAVLFAVGGLIYVGAVVCLPYVYDLTDKTPQYAVGYSAAIFLGAGQLFDQLTSINDTLISYSDYYRWNAFFVLVMGGANLLLNYVLIVQLGYGIAGAALATAISLFFYNLLKLVFIKWKMGITPFSPSLAWTALVLFGIGLVAYYLPGPDSAVLNLLLRGGIIGLLFLTYLRFTDGVPALRRVLKGGLKAMF